MIHLAVSWTVLVGLAGPVASYVQDPEISRGDLATGHDPGLPLWSICRSSASGDPQWTAATEEERGTGRPRAPWDEDSGGGQAVSGGETSVPVFWIPCETWGSALLSRDEGAMGGAHGGDGEEIPVCVDDAQCGPVTPKKAPCFFAFSAAKAALLSQAAPPDLLPCQAGERQLGGQARAGFPRAPFRPPDVKPRFEMRS